MARVAERPRYLGASEQRFWARAPREQGWKEQRNRLSVIKSQVAAAKPGGRNKYMVEEADHILRTSLVVVTHQVQQAVDHEHAHFVPQLVAAFECLRAG